MCFVKVRAEYIRRVADKYQKKIAFGMMLELLRAYAFRCSLRTELKVDKGIISIMMDPGRKLALKLKFNENSIS